MKPNGKNKTWINAGDVASEIIGKKSMNKIDRTKAERVQKPLFKNPTRENCSDDHTSRIDVMEKSE